MNRHVVFTVHGMGQHTDNWSTPGIDCFQAVADAIGYPKDIKDSLEFVEINYNHLFEEYLAQNKKQSESLTSFIEKSASINRSSFYKGLHDYASEVPDNDNFVVNALGDVFLYRATEYEHVVTSFVTSTIVNTLNNMGNSHKWSLIGHSLGTRVVHDAASILLSDTQFINAYGKPTCIAMIANVCHLLAYRPSELWSKTPVFPSDSLDGGCFRYVNAMHPLDPFMWIRPFIPTSQWGSGASSRAEYLNVAILEGDLKRQNPHSFAGYLENPRVVAALCQGLGTKSRRQKAFDRKKLSAVIKEYESATLTGNVAAIRDKAMELRERRSAAGFREFVGALREFEAFLNTLGISLSEEDK
ncbi:MAG: hypothetical protein AB8B64_17835 [Granulosicoccus sp.]